MTPSEELSLERLKALHPKLYDHNPAAMALAVRAFRAMAAVASRNTPAIRCNHSDRFRRMQLDCSEKLPFVDVASMAIENGLGADVALAGIRVIAAAIGYELAPVGDVPQIGTNEALATLTLASADLEAAVTLRRPAEEIDHKARTTLAAVRLFTSKRVKARMEFYRQTRETR